MRSKPGERYFIAERNQSYACRSKDELKLQEYLTNNTVSETDIQEVQAEVWNAHVQAFDLPPSGKFSQSKFCSNILRRLY